MAKYEGVTVNPGKVSAFMDGIRDEKEQASSNRLRAAVTSAVMFAAVEGGWHAYKKYKKSS